MKFFYLEMVADFLARYWCIMLCCSACKFHLICNDCSIRVYVNMVIARFYYIEHFKCKVQNGECSVRVYMECYVNNVIVTVGTHKYIMVLRTLFSVNGQWPGTFWEVVLLFTNLWEWNTR